MRMSLWAALIAVSFSTAAYGQNPDPEYRPGYTVSLWTAATVEVTVTNNGVIVCRMNQSSISAQRCHFNMIDGNNHIVIMGPNGTSANTVVADVLAPTSDPPSYYIQDCDFQPGGCEE